MFKAHCDKILTLGAAHVPLKRLSTPQAFRQFLKIHRTFTDLCSLHIYCTSVQVTSHFSLCFWGTNHCCLFVQELTVKHQARSPQQSLRFELNPPCRLSQCHCVSVGGSRAQTRADVDNVSSSRIFSSHVFIVNGIFRNKFTMYICILKVLCR